jgi:hypothetical protein
MVDVEINKAPAQPSTAQPSTFASQPSFLQRILNFTFQLNSNPSTAQPTTFADTGGWDTGSDTVNLSGYRARCRITNATTPLGSYCEGAVFGMSQSLMNQLAAVGPSVNSINRNNVIISAGAASNDSAAAENANQAPSSGFPVVFGGTIYFAFGDYNNMPDVPFRFSARAGLYQQVQSVAAVSYKGSTSIVSIMQTFANQLSVPLENNGVSSTLQNPYYPGSLMQQIYQAAEHANIFAQLVDGGTKLAIWPRNGGRTSQTNSPLISAATGMIGYPTFGPNSYLYVRALYNPDVLFKGTIQIQSSIQQANGLWTVQKMDLVLDSLLPGGDWQMVLQCWPANTTSPPPPSVT